MSAIFEAKYDGWCPACTDAIKAGEQVTYRDDTLVHANCPDHPDQDAPRRNEIRCPECWLVHAGECA